AGTVAPGLAVQVAGIGKRYKHAWALQDVSFEVAPGEMLAVVGADGAGKTTLIQLLAGLLELSAGSANVAGLDVATAGTALGERVGYMSEGFTLYGSLTVAENLAFFADLYGVAGTERSSRTADLLRFSRLNAALDRRASQLSGGMQKKLALCCVLIHEPEVLLLDEPTVGVDPLSRQEFWRLLERFLVGGVAIVMTTAYLDEAERCQQVLFLEGGRAVLTGRPGELRSGFRAPLWELRSPNPEKAMNVLSTEYGAGQVYRAGRRLRVVSPAEKRDPAALLAAAGLAVEDERRVAPRLEDVFVAQVATVTDVPQPARAATAKPSAGGMATGIAARAMSKRFGNLTALDNVTLQVQSGEVFGLLGPNGSGKSTFIRILTGLLPSTAGSGMVAGHDIAGPRGAVQQLVGYMSQRFSLYLDMTVRENIQFYGGVYGLAGSRAQDRERWALSFAGLASQEDTRASGLGGGQRQRLALAVALLHEPPVLFLDEPTSGVDPLARRRFWDLIYAIAQAGTTVLVSTHYMDEAERCDKIAFLDAGRIVAQGTPDELKAQATRGLGGQLYVAETDRPVYARELLTQTASVTNASVYGDTVRFVLAPGASPDAVARRLKSAELRAH
ncbi:MAG: ABC transporter ATP-binding protein, partial [Chloroflexota bacterium]|nr:ABC transporter ATP-binding protein [Chloroflexota bacterium]